jgi:hypothetical protein
MTKYKNKINTIYMLQSQPYNAISIYSLKQQIQIKKLKS